MIWISAFLLVTVAVSMQLETVSAEKSFYTAAVLEHAKFGHENHTVQEVVERNLHVYRKAAEIARAKGADIIVYPEYGLFPPGERPMMKRYLEHIPDPRKIHTNPCQEPNEYIGRPILRSLSCLARNNSIVVVANMGDIQTCEDDPQCPADGAFHFNTNVVFQRDGTLLMKYHKEHLFFEFGMDPPKEKQNYTFETEFGKFATFISFDIMFENMSRVAQRPDVDAIVLPIMWVNAAPQLTSVQLFQSWSIGNNATLIAADIQIPGYFTVGSGIFQGEAGALAYTFNPDGISKLIVAKVPKNGHPPITAEASTIAITPKKSWSWMNDFRDVPRLCSRTLLNDTTDIYNEYRCVEEITTSYTFVKLTKRSDHMEVCNNGMCCTLDYTATDIPLSFYLGVFNGTHNSYGRYFWAEENCVMVHCDGVGDNPCATFPMRSTTAFHHVRLHANFTTDFVYPSVVESGMRLFPRSDWKYELSTGISREAIINFKSREGRKLIAVGFKGRCYDRDPPYIR